MTGVPPVLAHVPDLMDRSRLSAAAPGVRFVARAEDLVAAAGDSPVGTVVVVDLNRPGVAGVLAAVVATGRRTVGFAGHLEREVLDRARAAGVESMPRSEFFRRTAEVLSPS